MPRFRGKRRRRSLALPQQHLIDMEKDDHVCCTGASLVYTRVDPPGGVKGNVTFVSRPCDLSGMRPME